MKARTAIEILFGIIIVLHSVYSNKHEICELFDKYECECTRSTAKCKHLNEGKGEILINPIRPISTMFFGKFSSVTLLFEQDKIHVRSYTLWHMSPILLSKSESNARPKQKNQINVHITFKDFNELLIDDNAFMNSFTKNQFDYTHLSIELYSRRQSQLFMISKNAFSGFEANSLSIYCNTKQINFQFSFVELFNNTIVHSLRTEGFQFTIEPADQKEVKFNGRVDKLIVTKQVAIINDQEFTFNPYVQYYGIKAHNAKSLDSNSFKNHKNLYGFELCSNEIWILSDTLSNLCYLKDLILDVEFIGSNAFSELRNLRRLTLGKTVKILKSTSLNSLPDNAQHLRSLDISKANLAGMSYESRCSLLSFVLRAQHLKIIAPIEVKGQRHCDCHLQVLRKFLTNKIKINKPAESGDTTKVDEAPLLDDKCTFRICQFPDCPDAQWFRDHELREMRINSDGGYNLNNSNYNKTNANVIDDSSIILQIPLITARSKYSSIQSDSIKQSKINKSSPDFVNTNEQSIIKTSTDYILMDDDHNLTENSGKLYEIGRFINSSNSQKHTSRIWIMGICICFLVIAILSAIILLYFVYIRIGKDYMLIPQQSTTDL
ncbi:hypothetical protein GJ496_003422 [Pomphorhynchus laevis]|nr:hypothetical protein GJ496_003422 [Pomphorhynchus laevis]